MAQKESPYNPFLTERRNDIILSLHKEGFMLKDIAFMMNRSEQLIGHIIKNSKNRI